jgi:hypothetical protein
LGRRDDRHRAEHGLYALALRLACRDADEANRGIRGKLGGHEAAEPAETYESEFHSVAVTDIAVASALRGGFFAGGMNESCGAKVLVNASVRRSRALEQIIAPSAAQTLYT